MKLNLFVSVAAAVCLTWPAAALADPPAGADQGGSQQNDHGKGDQGGGHGKAAGQGGSGGQGQASNPGQGGNQGKAGNQGQAAAGGQIQVGSQVGSGGSQGGQRQVQVRSARTPVMTQGGQSGGQGGQPQVHARRTAPQGGQTQFGSQSGSSGQGGQPQYQVRRTTTRGGQTAVTGVQVQQGQGLTTYRQAHQAVLGQPANRQVLTVWNRSATGPARDQAGQQWRTSHTGWNNDAVWRRNSNWWQGNSAFRLWGGARLGFFFIPELGYISVPVAYRTHYWRDGDTLPSWFWRYSVRDYWNYGLPEPPEGCAWVWVNNDVALIDLSDGYVLDIEHNIW